VGDLTSTNTAPVPVQAPAADRAPAPALRRPPPGCRGAGAVSHQRRHRHTAQPAVSAPQTQPVATTPANPSAELKIYDTTTQPMSQLLAQVQQDGATLVVGPLLKDNVEDVIKSNTRSTCWR
jgi:outer membrane PBP1 activator LpoA protein